jgi:syndetin
LRKTFKVIREYTNKLHKDSIQVGIQTRPSDLIYPLPKFNQMIDLDKPPYAIVSRITAVQSLHVLFSVISNLSPKFHNFLPKSKSKFIDDVITEIENTTKEVHKLILSRTMLSVYDISEVPNLISGMKWENQTIEMGVASPYVGVIEKALKEFVKTLGHLSELSPKEIIEELWDLVVVRTMELLVEGYSKIKKCDPIGRNQMKFDLSTIEQSIKKKSSLANIPKVSHAREYIDGYYYSDEFILEWIVQHATVIFNSF